MGPILLFLARFEKVCKRRCSLELQPNKIDLLAVRNKRLLSLVNDGLTVESIRMYLSKSDLVDLLAGVTFKQTTNKYAWLALGGSVCIGSVKDLTAQCTPKVHQMGATDTQSSLQSDSLTGY